MHAEGQHAEQQAAAQTVEEKWVQHGTSTGSTVQYTVYGVGTAVLYSMYVYTEAAEYDIHFS